MHKYALCSPFLPKKIREKIEETGSVQCVEIPPYEALPEPVSHHPDMLFFNPCDKNVTLLSDAYHAVNPRFFTEYTSEALILDRRELGCKYPQDVAFDALGINDTLYCLEAHTSDAVKSIFSKIINIKQGYAACSTLVLNAHSAITADKSIAKALTADGIDVLLISADGILLPGYGCGFIGGASVVINSTAIFFGNLKNHPSGEDISKFCQTQGVRVVDFPHLPLTDYGSIRYLYSN